MNVDAPGWVLPEDLQAIYDYVARHLLRQGRPALAPESERDALVANGHIICRYRGTCGTKCAVGCLIPDALYSPGMENGWGPIVLACIGLLTWDEVEGQESPRVLLLSALQKLHDAAANWAAEDVMARWIEGLFCIARDFGLRPLLPTEQ